MKRDENRGEKRWATPLLALLVLASPLFPAISACTADGRGGGGASKKAEGDKAKGGALSTTPGETPGRPSVTPREGPAPEMLAGAHILIAFKGAARARPNVTRTKEEAKRIAEEVAARVKKHPETFADEARRSSDSPSASLGGELDVWPRGRMLPAFDEAFAQTPIGKVAGPFETAFGYHIIFRRAPQPPVRLSASQILIAYQGAPRASKEVTRTREEARHLAEELAVQAKKEPARFADLARQRSNDPRAKEGGPIGVWTTGRGMPVLFSATVRTLKIGEVSGVVESPFGFHVFMRTEVVEPPLLAGSHILLAYKDAERARPTVSRTKEEALALAKKIHEELEAKPASFGALATKHSDCPSAAQGGSLGSWPKGRMAPAFDAALEKLKPGEISGPIETPFGYHLIRRDAPPAKGSAG
jgi:peptidyl-prolyl cis-trans isomerase SurA